MTKDTEAVTQTPKFVFLLNAMENAAIVQYPAEHGYWGKRQAVLDYVAKLETALQAATEDAGRKDLQLSGFGEDSARMDWLEQKVVQIRFPMRYGSLEGWYSTPDEEGNPSDLRNRIDAALEAIPNE